MKYLHIEVLTPLHVGSGRTLKSNTEFLKFDEVVSVIDDHKILKIIGEENIEKWVDIISNGGDLLKYLNQRSPTEIVPQQTDKRILPIVGNYLKPENGLREHIFSGNGKPLLPGSSLKGAIRTGLLNEIIKDNFLSGKEREKRNRYKTYFDKAKNEEVITNKFDDGNIQTAVFGKDPNHDSLRMLRIGDAHFERTICLVSQTFNQKNGLEIKEKVNQLVECIPVGAETVSGVSIAADLLEEIKKPKYQKVLEKFKSFEEVTDFTKIFKKINAYSKIQSINELKRYEPLVHDMPEQAKDFIEKLHEIVNKIDDLQKSGNDSCIIRVGFGSGYLNMTGGWVLNHITFKSEEFNRLSRDVRKDHKDKKYDNMILPKSRKIISGGVPMGFLKLTLWTAEQAEEWKNKALLRQQQIQQQQAQAAEEARLKAEQDAEAARIAAEEAKKPKLFEGKLKRASVIDAEVINITGNVAKIKLYVPDHENRLFELRYAGLQIGQTLEVEVKDISGKGIVLAVGFRKIK